MCSLFIIVGPLLVRRRAAARLESEPAAANIKISDEHVHQVPFFHCPLYMWVRYLTVNVSAGSNNAIVVKRV